MDSGPVCKVGFPGICVLCTLVFYKQGCMVSDTCFICVCLYFSQVVVVRKSILFAWDRVSYLLTEWESPRETERRPIGKLVKN